MSRRSARSAAGRACKNIGGERGHHFFFLFFFVRGSEVEKNSPHTQLRKSARLLPPFIPSRKQEPAASPAPLCLCSACLRASLTSMGSSSGSKRRRGADDAASSERNKTLHSSFATAANAVAGLYSAASAAQKSASAAGARAVLVRNSSSARDWEEGERAKASPEPFFFFESSERA